MPKPTLRPHALSLVAAIAAALLLPVLAVPGAQSVEATATAAAAGPTAALTAARAPKAQKSTKVRSRSVSFEVVNTNETSVACEGDNRNYTVRGRLVGPRQVVNGYAGATRFNVLVHDAGTGGWFWNLSRHPRYDYATQLAKQGETSLVLDRLGYDRSPLGNGRATCLGAQATMLKQVIQKLYAGTYTHPGPSDFPPHAGQIIVHGHGTGGAIAQLEAAEFKDTAGLVLMSWSGANGASNEGISEARRQFTSCLGFGSTAAYGASAADYRNLLFGRASGRVQKSAVRLRNVTPCGDVTSLASAALTADSSARDVRVPVLVLVGSEDRRIRGNAEQAGSAFTRSSNVTARTIPGAGSALPLEKSAPKTRRIVEKWLRRR